MEGTSFSGRNWVCASFRKRYNASVEAGTQDEFRWFSMRGWWPRLLFAALLALVGFWAYRPAFNRVFAQDQILYLAELQGDTSLHSGLRLLDYAAARQYARGDQLSYRPLLFAWLAAESAAFGCDFRAWNQTGLAVHVLMAYLLFEILWRRQRSWVTCGFALLFALLATNFELVSWNHLNGYILGYGFLLIAFAAAMETWPGAGHHRPSIPVLAAYACAMSCAMLMHEVAVVAALGVVAIGLAAGWRKPAVDWRRLGVAWGVPLAAYAILYAFHAAQCDRLFWADRRPAVGGLFMSPTAAWICLFEQWGLGALLPDQCRISVLPLCRAEWAAPIMLGGVKTWGILALWAGAAGCLWRGFTRDHLKTNWPAALFSIGLVAAYAAMNMVGRSYAPYVTYYVYFPVLWGMVGFYYLVDFSKVARRNQICALAILLLLAALHGRQTHRISKQVEASHAALARYYGWLDRSVRPHLADPGFTFAVPSAPPELDPLWIVTKGYQDQGVLEKKSISEWLYGKRYDPTNPAAILAYPGAESPAPANGGWDWDLLFK